MAEEVWDPDLKRKVPKGEAPADESLLSVMKDVRNLLRTCLVILGCQSYHVPGRQCETCRDYIRRGLPDDKAWGNEDNGHLLPPMEGGGVPR